MAVEDIEKYVAMYDSKDGWLVNDGSRDRKPNALHGHAYRLRFRNGEEAPSEPETVWRWDHNGHTHDIVSYKITD